MRRFISEYLWFSINAVLLAGLIAVGAQFEANTQEPAAVGVSAKTPVASSSQDVPSVNVGEENVARVLPTVSLPSTQPATPPAAIPRVQGEREYDDD